MKANLGQGDSKLIENSLKIATVLSAGIFVIPNKETGYQTLEQVGRTRGFIFDVVNKEQLTRQADITDHYIEDNSLLHNHLSKKPLSFAVSGFKGEVQDVVSSGDDTFTDLTGVIAGAIDLTLQTANLASAALGKSAASVTNLLDANYKAQQAYRAFAISKSYYDSIRDSEATGWEALVNRMTRQERAFKLLNSYFESNTLFTVQTPYGRFSDMLIQELRATQNDDSTSYSDFELTFKQIRKVGSSIRSLRNASGTDSTLMKDKVSDGTVQSSSPVNKGKA